MNCMRKSSVAGPRETGGNGLIYILYNVCVEKHIKKKSGSLASYFESQSVSGKK